MATTFNFRVKKGTVVTVDLIYLLTFGSITWLINIYAIESPSKVSPLALFMYDFMFLFTTAMLAYFQYSQINLTLTHEGVTIPFLFLGKRAYKWDELRGVSIGPHYVDLFFSGKKVQIPVLMFKNGPEGIAFIEDIIESRPQVKVLRYK